jgi:hypothetical protein
VRAVIDTNGLVAGLLWRRPPHSLLEHARTGALSAISSSKLLAEFRDVLGRTKFASIVECGRYNIVPRNPPSALPAWLRDSPSFVAGLNLLDDGLTALLPVFAQNWFFVLWKR